MSLVASRFPDERHISRKLTISVDQAPINVRPVIKGATKEAAHTLTDAYKSEPLMSCWRDEQEEDNKHHEFLYILFKNMINTATLQSRDFAVQVEGCKGVLVWTNQPQGCPWPHVLSTAKLASYIGWGSALRTVLKFQPSCDKMRRKVMAEYDDISSYITIGYIGVLPHEQRKGLGSALLQHVIDKADEAGGVPILVQASDERAIRFFGKFGFVTKAQMETGSSRRHKVLTRFMVREPRSAAGPRRPLRIRPGRHNSDYST